MYLLKKNFPRELEVTKDGKMKNEGQIRKERCKTFVKITSQTLFFHKSALYLLFPQVKTQFSFSTKKLTVSPLNENLESLKMTHPSEHT